MYFIKRHFFKLSLWFSTAAAVSLLIGIFSGISNLYRAFLPSVLILQAHYPVFDHKEGNHNYYRFVTAKPAQWRPLKGISHQAVSAILMSEDGGFYQHEGYEPEAIRKAWEGNKKAGKYKRGGSTITQQVVKNLFLSPDKTLTRKARELLLAVELEKALSKRNILEIYLNIAEWGPKIYGIEQASQYYFKKSSAEITAREGAILAFMLPNPIAYQKSYHNGTLSDFGSERVATILERLWMSGQISDEEYASASKESALPSSM